MNTDINKLIEYTETLEQGDAIDAELAEVQQKPNRAERRSMLKRLKRMLRPPHSQTTMYELGDTSRQLTPNGVERIAKRRVANKVARTARKRNRG